MRHHRSHSRQFNPLGIGLTAAAGLALLAALPKPAAAQTYGITNLGTLGGGPQADGLGTNGTAAGTSTLSSDGTQRAFLKAPGGTIQNLGTLGGSSSAGTGVTDVGVTRVVGYSNLAGDTTTHAFLYTAGGVGGPAGNPQMRDLGTLSSDTSQDSLAFGINTLGQVVGNSISNVNGEDHAFRTQPGLNINGATDDLGTLGGGFSVANGINNTGQAVGQADLADNNSHAFRSAANGSPNVLTDLGTLGGSNSSANAINASGQVVGVSDLTGDATSHAFVWTQGATNGVPGNMQMTDLGTLFSGGISQANGINDAGAIVGFSFLDDGTVAKFDAFLYSNGKLVDLNSLIDPSSGWILQDATGINNNGQIAGYGLFQGQQQAFLLNLSAAPEPSALCVLAIGLGALGLLAARKRRCASAE